MGHIRISAAICTHNRGKLLSKAIESLLEQSIKRSAYEILVVDNGSTDGTRDIVKKFDREKNFKYIIEPNIGVSYARNLAWKVAQGEIIAYLDDDAIACKEWLERIITAFRAIPNLGAVGGRVEPIWEKYPPPWINDNIMRSLSIVDWSEKPTMLGDKNYLVCTNIAFPKKILEQVSGFSLYLGRKGKSLISNEEIELIIKIKKLKRNIYYDPAILVKHFVSASRLKPKWFRKRWFMQGVSSAIMYRNLENPSNSEKLFLALKRLVSIFKGSYNWGGLFFPSLFPKMTAKCHDSIIGFGFIYGLFKVKEL